MAENDCMSRVYGEERKRWRYDRSVRTRGGQS